MACSTTNTQIIYLKATLLSNPIRSRVTYIRIYILMYPLLKAISMQDQNI